MCMTRSLGRLRRMTAVLVLSVAMLCMGLAVHRRFTESAPVPRLTCRELTLVDGGGNERVRLGLNDSGEPSLYFRDKAGVPRIGVAIVRGRPAFIVSGPDGKDVRLSAGWNEAENGPEIALWADGSGFPRMTMQVSRGGLGFLSLLDDRGTARLMVEGDCSGDVVIRMVGARSSEIRLGVKSEVPFLEVRREGSFLLKR